MEVIIYENKSNSTQINKLGIIENAEVVWTTRYYKNGEFQLYLPATEKNKSLIKEGYIVGIEEDKDNVGIIEDLHFTFSDKEGEMITVNGKFAPKLLGQRIIPQQTQVYGTVQNCIRDLIISNVISPTKKSRVISKVKLGEYIDTIDEKMSMQITGANLLTKIEEICETYKLGFKMYLKGGLDDELVATKYFTFELYKGQDKSKEVVFNDIYDNLLNCEYIRTTSGKKNVFLIASEGEGVDRKVLWGSQNDDEDRITGEDRYEIYVDQRNMSSNNGDITDKEFYQQMNDEGKTNLISINEAFSGEVILNNYKYGKSEDGGDVYIGDVVKLENKSWGIYIKPRIIEVVKTWDKTGQKITLTFGN